MKKQTIKTIAAFVLLTATLALNSCRRDRDNNDKDFTTANNMAMADETYNDVDNIADEGATTGAVTYKTEDENSLLAGCAVVTRDTTSSPRLTTIDFGTGCTGADGKLRTGKIIVTHTGRYRYVGTTITITFDNYTVNGNQVSGTRTINNEGLNNNGHPFFSVGVSGQIILANGNGTITWTSTRERVWTAGESTPTRDDDQYSITGSATGTAANGDQFTAGIQQALIRNLAPGCRRHFVSGVALIQRSGKPDRTLDFGNGTCDDQATVTINGVSHAITLR